MDKTIEGLEIKILIPGVDHGEDLSYLFYNPKRGRVGKKDKVMRRKLVRLWSNFAKYGYVTDSI